MVGYPPNATALALAGIAFLSAADAGAQTPDDSARAQAAFNAGKELRDSGHYAEACPKFAESERIARGVGVLLYLADCYEHVGRLASAWAKFRQADELALQRRDGRAALAHKRADALEPKLNRLTIAVAHPESHADWELRLDGVALPRDYWNAEMATDPGDHVVTVSAPGQAPRTLQTHIDAATPESVLAVNEAGRDSPMHTAQLVDNQTGAGAPTAQPLPAPEAEQSTTSNAATWHVADGVLLGVTVVGLGVGVSFLAVKNQAASSGRPGTSNDSSWAGPASAVSFAAAGSALAAAIVVYLAAPRDKSTGAIVAPVPMVGGGGAVLRTSF